MDSALKKITGGLIDIDETHEYQYRKICGFTFVFKKEIISINGRISSGEIKPFAIIYEENGQYYLSPIDEVDEIEEVVKQYVEKILKK